MNKSGAQPTEVPVPSGQSFDTSAVGLARDTVVYGIGMVLSKIVSFLMLPVYTRVLTPADYGVLQLVTITENAASVMFSAGTLAGVLRFYYKAQTPAERATIVFTAFSLFLVLNTFGGGAIFLSAPWLATTLLDGPSSDILFQLTAVSFFFIPFVEVPTLFMQIKKRPALFVMTTLTRLILQISLNIYLLYGARIGVLGVVIGNLVATVTMGLIATTWMIRQTGPRVSKKAARSLRDFGIPHQIAAAGAFFLTFGDRYFLEVWRDLTEVGLYGLAYQFGFLLMTLGAFPFLRAWNPRRFELAAAPRAERDRMYNRGSLYLSLVALGLLVTICVMVRPILSVMAPPSFHRAAVYVPIILAAYLTHIWSQVAALGIDVSERTKYAGYATWLGALVALVLYLTLIPMWGALGAAVATLMSFLTKFVFTYYWSQKLWPISYEWKPHLQQVGLAIPVILIAISVNPGGTVAQLTLGGGLLAAYLSAVWWWVLPRTERAALVRRATALVQRVRTRHRVA